VVLVVAVAVALQAVAVAVALQAVAVVAVALQSQYINEDGWTLPAWINYMATLLFPYYVLGEIVGTISWS
jgi:hypothetical protein